MSSKKYISRLLKVTALMDKTTKRMKRVLSTTPSEKIENEWLYSADIMQILKISESTLRRMRKKGEIPFQKIGGTYRYPSIYIEKTLLEKVMKKHKNMFDEE